MAVPSAVAGLLRRPARLGDEVYSAIFSAIMALEIAPGDRIGVDGLARQLGVSPTPVREALTRLEAEGLVVKTHLVGYSAAPRFSAGQLADLFELRALLEPAAAGKAAHLMTAAAIAQLDGLCAEMAGLQHAEGRDGYAQFAQLDLAFHDQIAAHGGNGLLAEALGRLHTHVHLFRLAIDTMTAAALAEHRCIVAAIRARDDGGARTAMSAHIAASRLRFSRGLPG